MHERGIDTMGQGETEAHGRGEAQTASEGEREKKLVDGGTHCYVFLSALSSADRAVLQKLLSMRIC